MLVEYGRLGHVGQFETPDVYPRDATVVIETSRGTELGRVLHPAAHLPDITGQLLRLATADDLEQSRACQTIAEAILAEAQQFASDDPIAIVDCELPLEGAAVLHVLPWDACDLDPLLQSLATRFARPVYLLDVSTRPDPTEAVKSGCSSGGCSSGGCSSGGCSSGGCSTGGCSRKQVKSAGELTDYFATLRTQMEATARQRLPLG